ncbi:MAG: agmatinase, partial [Desulfobacteraceae bacterium]|nr:agmatinase [Desulfobacteraceae bacterium]
MEKNKIKRLVQAGIRTMNGHQKSQASRFGVEVIEMKDGMEPFNKLIFSGPVYLSIDIDCLDPAFAPGVSHHEPGGMSTRQLLDIIQNIKGDIVGADIVEYNPKRDEKNITGMVAAKLLKEVIDLIYSGMVSDILHR